MKTHLLLIILLVSTFMASAQTAQYGQLNDKGKFDHYITKAGNTISVGDTLVLGQPSAPNHFNYITQGNQFVAVRLAGSKVVITELKSWGKKKQGYKLYAGFKGYGMVPVYIDYEQAMATGEVINPSASLTREQALKKLKEAKDLVDVEMMSRADFEALKKKLAPIIAGN